jgi:hypothetical protein
MIAVTKAWLIAIWAIVVVSPFVTIGILKVSESRGHADIQKAIPWAARVSPAGGVELKRHCSEMLEIPRPG